MLNFLNEPYQRGGVIIWYEQKQQPIPQLWALYLVVIYFIFPF